MLEIKYDYVPKGYGVPWPGAGPNSLYLDVGNVFLEGVIDHHHLVYGQNQRLTCTAKMVALLLLTEDIKNDPPWQSADETMSRINAWKRASNRKDIEVTIYFHEDPDLDSFYSAFIIEKYLQGVSVEELKPLLQSSSFLEVIELADQGKEFPEKYLDEKNIHLNPYLVLEAIKFQHHNSQKFWDNVREDFFKYLQMVLEDKIDSADHVYSEQINLMKEGLDEFWENDVNHNVPIKVPSFMIQDDNAIHLISRDVVYMQVPSHIGKRFNLFKVLFRKRGGPVWIVHRRPREAHPFHTIILSVSGEEKMALFGMGWHLERWERKLRRSGKYPDYPPRIGPFRPGYDGPDPWYDGRNQNYTIVDSPICGTVMGEDIELFFQIISEENSRWEQSLLEAFSDMTERAMLSGGEFNVPLEQAIKSKVKDRLLRLRLQEIELASALRS